jgi:hypothetical protein
MKKVISFSLWGDNPKYTIGAIKNAELIDTIYPGWIGRFYCGKSVPIDIIEILKTYTNVEVIEMEENGDWSGMFWRFYACEDSDVMISRDTDSRLNLREKNAVDEWLNSDKDFHIMRDHPYHNALILGGMWGVRNGILKNIVDLIKNYNKGDFWQVDQNFLREKIYPIVVNTSFVHDSYHNLNSWSKNFSIERIDQEFVGDVFDEHNQRHSQYYKLIS